VWTRPGGIESTREVMGYRCLRYAPANAVSVSTTTSQPGFFPMDAGDNRACRGASATDNSASYYDVFVGSLEDCKTLCVQQPNCVGIEVNRGGRCEVWKRPEGIGATVAVSGYQCLRYEQSVQPRDAEKEE